MIHLICLNPAIDRTILLKSIKTSTPNRPIEVKEFPGGKSFNVAYALNYEEDTEITIHTILGGIYGEHLLSLAKEKNYFIQATNVEKNTRLCNVLVDVSKKEIVPIYENGFELNPEILFKFTNKLINSIDNNDIVVFSGSLIQGIPSNYISEVSKKLLSKNLNIKLCIDTSGQALIDTYNQTTPYLIKINDEEIKDLFPNMTLNSIDDYLNLLKNNIKKDIPNFIITLGKDGIIARIDNSYYTGFSKPVSANNPIGCGDFFLGRLIRGIRQGAIQKDTLISALQFSTCNVMNWYPEVTKKQLLEIIPNISVNKIIT